MINTNHETNDPLIFAAGPLTKFSRRYRAEQWLAPKTPRQRPSPVQGHFYAICCLCCRSHANYNSKEVGERLASTMLSRLDPTLGYYESEDTAPSDTDAIPVYTQPSDTLPVYTQPKATAAYLPGTLIELELPTVKDRNKSSSCSLTHIQVDITTCMSIHQSPVPQRDRQMPLQR